MARVRTAVTDLADKVNNMSVLEDWDHKLEVDEYLKKLEGPEGWILLSEIYNFRKMRKFHAKLSCEALYTALKLSAEVDVKECFVDWGYEKEVTSYIRKKP